MQGVAAAMNYALKMHQKQLHMYSSKVLYAFRCLLIDNKMDDDHARYLCQCYAIITLLPDPQAYGYTYVEAFLIQPGSSSDKESQKDVRYPVTQVDGQLWGWCYVVAAAAAYRFAKKRGRRSAHIHLLLTGWRLFSTATFFHSFCPSKCMVGAITRRMCVFFASPHSPIFAHPNPHNSPNYIYHGKGGWIFYA